MARASRHRSPWRGRTLALAFGGVLVGVAELGARAMGVVPAYQPEALGQWRMQANLGGRHTQGPRDGHSFMVTTNEDGLRTTLARARTPGVPRVALLGDSTVFGWGVDDGDTVADGVAEGLPGIEVLNAGQPGYSTTQAAWLLGEVVAAYQPDLAVFFIPMHDHNMVLVSDREVLEGGSTAVARSRVLLARHSSLYQALRSLIFPHTDRPFLLPDQATSEPRVERVSDAERSRALADARTALAGHGGRVVVGWLPFLADIEGPRGGERPSGPWARALARDEAVPLVDVRACCSGPGLVLADDPGHLSAAGNREAGLAVAAELPSVLGDR